MAAHPRACGDHRLVRVEDRGGGGSSPRVRGPRVRRRDDGLLPRLIPARAGTTWPHPTSGPRRPAHPRACGDHGSRGAIRVGGEGSSPRVRGPPLAPDPDRAAGTAHPRACGDHAAPDAPMTATLGSSPRVRGPRAERPQEVGDRRLIPARAGTTSSRAPAQGPGPAHPRACGDHLYAEGRGLSGAGSSPRVRGPRQRAQRGSRAPAAHPRACGDHADEKHGTIPTIGSSPRVRGPLGPEHAAAGPERLIPARAGTTRPLERIASRTAAHPRACGDHGTLARVRRLPVGSSPRVRGPRAQNDGESERGTAHPRACGDHARAGRDQAREDGSSPRVRGPLRTKARARKAERLIPARAGTTRRPRRAALCGPAHPRACGDHPSTTTPQRDVSGSSPRVRGPRGPPRACGLG